MNQSTQNQQQQQTYVTQSQQQQYHYRQETTTHLSHEHKRRDSATIVHYPYTNNMAKENSVSSISVSPAPAFGQFPQHVDRDSHDPSNSPSEQDILKCAAFFKSLLKMRPQQQQIYSILDLKNLLREVLLGEQTPEEFTVRLREVTKSQDKGNLLPFLRRALPALRRSIQNGEYLELRQALDLDDYSPKSLPTPPNDSRQTDSSNNIFIMEKSQQYNNTIIQTKPPSNGLSYIDDKNDGLVQEYSNSTTDMQEVVNQGDMIPSESNIGTDIPPLADNLNNLPQMLLNPQALADRILMHMPSADGVDPEVLTLISNATEARLRTILVHLAVLAEHRLEPLRINPLYQLIDEPRKQLRFMEDIDKRAHENRQTAEKEALLKITKSKGKDKDTLEKAKQIQKADREAMVNREANAAAFAALGGSKIGTKRALTTNTGADWKGGMQQQGLGAGLTGARASRVKRVTIRDLQFFLSSDPATPNTSKFRNRLAFSGLNVDENSSA